MLNRANLIADHGDALALDILVWPVHAAGQHKEAYGRLPFQLIRDANNGAFRYIFVRRQHFLHAAGR